MTISRLMFYVFGADPFPNTEQPEVILVVGGSAGPSLKGGTEFNLQTTVVQRVLDFE